MICIDQRILGSIRAVYFLISSTGSLRLSKVKLASRVIIWEVNSIAEEEASLGIYFSGWAKSSRIISTKLLADVLAVKFSDFKSDSSFSEL